MSSTWRNQSPADFADLRRYVERVEYPGVYYLCATYFFMTTEQLKDLKARVAALRRYL